MIKKLTDTYFIDGKAKFNTPCLSTNFYSTDHGFTFQFYCCEELKDWNVCGSDGGDGASFNLIDVFNALLIEENKQILEDLGFDLKRK